MAGTKPRGSETSVAGPGPRPVRSARCYYVLPGKLETQRPLLTPPLARCPRTGRPAGAGCQAGVVIIPAQPGGREGSLCKEIPGEGQGDPSVHPHLCSLKRSCRPFRSHAVKTPRGFSPPSCPRWPLPIVEAFLPS